jgi:hypothetical protein
MKAVVSIDEETFSSAERFAQTRGIPRSKLYGLAVKEYVQNHTPHLITERLNQFYPAEPDETGEFVRQAAINLFNKEKW